MITVNSRRLLFTVIFLQEISRTENHPLGREPAQYRKEDKTVEPACRHYYPGWLT